jgi:TfoX/Sxy family transcriptional regulator of competence genes
MAYDEKLAERVRTALGRRSDVTERKMFGGLAFMLHGNMACGIMKDDLMLRLGPEAAAKTVKQKHARPMDFTGRPMTGMLYVAKEGVRTAKQLHAWLDKAEAFADTLPPK